MDEPFVSKTTQNPFKHLYKESNQFSRITPHIIADYENIVQLSIHLTQEAEKFRKEAERYHTLNKHLIEQNDKLKHEYEYIDARYAMAKKWLKNEFELRESAEKDRDVLAQIVQLCKELIEDDPKLFDQIGFLPNIPEYANDKNDDVMSQTSERSEKVDELLKKIKRVESCRSKRPLDMDDLRAEIEEMEPQNIDSTFDETGDVLNDLLSPEKAKKKRRSTNFRRKSGGRRSSFGYTIPQNPSINFQAPKPSGFVSFIEEQMPEETSQDGNMSILGEKCSEKDPITDKYLYTRKSRRDSGHGGRRRMSRELRKKNSENSTEYSNIEDFSGIVVDSKNEEEKIPGVKKHKSIGKLSKFQELAKQHEEIQKDELEQTSKNTKSDTLESMLPVKGKSFSKKLNRRSIFNPTRIGTPGAKKLKKPLGEPFRNEKMSLTCYCPENNNANRPIVPTVLQAAVFELKRRNAVEYNQVYRQTGNKIKVNVLADTLLVKNLSLESAKKELQKVRDTATITSFIKNFFSNRILEPILTYDGLTFLVNIVQSDKASKDSEVYKKYSVETMNKFKLALSQLNPVNIDTLSMMMLHFQLVEKSGSKNKITASVLAKSVAADLIGYRVSKPSFRDVRMAESYQVNVFKALLQVDGGFYGRFYKEDENEEGIQKSESGIFKKLMFK